MDVITPDRAPARVGRTWWQEANEASWRTAERFIHAQSPRDLLAASLGLPPAERRSTLEGPSYRGGDPAWGKYAARLGIRIIPDGKS